MIPLAALLLLRLLGDSGWASAVVEAFGLVVAYVTGDGSWASWRIV